jgi:hypothetical protein
VLRLTEIPCGREFAPAGAALCRLLLDRTKG